MIKVSNWGVKVAGILLLGATAWYLPWLLSNLNWDMPWLAIPFAVASLLTVAMTFVTVFNHWQYSVPLPSPVPVGQEPLVFVIIPTYGESPSMVYETAKSVLDQDYPVERIWLVISNDAPWNQIRAVVEQLKREYPEGHVGYFEPPKRGDPKRRGDAKSGNLNAVLDTINRFVPDVMFVETRDADDKVGDQGFLRQVTGLLLADSKVAYVQTIKESVVGHADPFGNQEPLFYRKAMLAKNAANAVFPCGSGLVWRREALAEIGGFPSWNLVEDLQSGVEALRRGWRGLYYPIVGAIGQTAPEDIPNTIKQRGTWALDTMRLTFWGQKKGLSLRQQLQFAELGFFYLLSFAVLVFAVTPVFALGFDMYALNTSDLVYTLHFWVYAGAVELLLVSLAGGLPYEALWRARQSWLGMAPVYARAVILALRYGPDRKPTYRVTRKEDIYGLYWKEILPQLILLLALIIAGLYHIATHSLFLTADLGSLFWAGFFVIGLSRVVRNSWYGVTWDDLLGKPARVAFGKSVIAKLFLMLGLIRQ